MRPGASLMRRNYWGDPALHPLLGIARFPAADSIHNLFRKFFSGHAQRLYERQSAPPTRGRSGRAVT
jgi:hypothetical protein